MDKKRLSINLISNVLSYFVATVLSFLITPFLVRNLGKEIYGFYGIANSFVNYITIVATALNSMAAKYITVEYVRGNESQAKKYYSSIFFSNVILCLVLTPILVVVILDLNVLLNISDVYVRQVQCLFGLIFAAMLLRFITSVYGTATYTTNRMDYRAYIDLVKAGLRLVLYLLLFTIFRPSIVYLGIVLFLLEAFNSIAQIVISKKLMPTLKIEGKYFDFRLVLQTLKIGIWNSLNQLGDLLLSSSDLIMANILLGESASGNISIIKTLPTLISGVITAINGVFMPRAANYYAQGNKKELVKEIKHSQKLMGTVITPLVVTLIVFTSDFLNLWVPGNDIELLTNLANIDISRMLIVAVVWPVANLNIILNKVKTPSLLVIASGVLNIVSMYALTTYTDIRIYAIVVTTFVLTLLFYGLFIPIYSSKNLEISLWSFLKAEGQMLLSSVVTYYVVKLIHSCFTINTWFSFIIIGGICGIVAIVIGLVVFWFDSINNVGKQIIRRK